MSPRAEPPRGALTRAQRVAVRLLPSLVGALYATWRVTTINDEAWRGPERNGRPVVFAMWHGDLLTGVLRHRGSRVAMVASEHRDGELIARVLQRLGYPVIRGSTSRGAARALLAMCDALARGTSVGVTPDGPRGPRHAFQPGAIVAAARSGAVLVPVGVAASRGWRLGSWDRFLIPAPFARVVIAYGDSWDVGNVAARDAAAAAPEAERRMAAAGAAAAAAVGAPV